VGATLDGYVAHAVNNRRGEILDRNRVAALGGVAAGIRCAPRARGVEGVTAVTSEVGHGADDGDGYTTAVVAGRRRIERPGAAALDDFVGHAGNCRRTMVFHRHRLTALGGVATGIGCPPRARGVESIAAVTGDVGHGANNGDGHGTAGV